MRNYQLIDENQLVKNNKNINQNYQLFGDCCLNDERMEIEEKK